DCDGAKRRAESVHAADAAGRAGWRAPGGGRKLWFLAARRHRREGLATGQARAPGTLRRKAACRHRAAVADRGRARALRTEDAVSRQAGRTVGMERRTSYSSPR